MHHCFSDKYIWNVYYSVNNIHYSCHAIIGVHLLSCHTNIDILFDILLLKSFYTSIVARNFADSEL